MVKTLAAKAKKNKKGFTLIELIVVIAILAILAMILIPSVFGYVKQAKQSNANTAADTVHTAAAAIIAAHPNTFTNAGVSVGDGSTNYFSATDPAPASHFNDNEAKIYFGDLKVLLGSSNVSAASITDIIVKDGNVIQVDVKIDGEVGQWKQSGASSVTAA